jgi:hypothetical protein
LFATHDHDGHTDDLYELEHPLIVERADGQRWRVGVRVEMVPEWRAVRMAVLEAKP